MQNVGFSRRSSYLLAVCDKGHIPILLGLEECSPENCHGTCTTGTNPSGIVLDICCTGKLYETSHKKTRPDTKLFWLYIDSTIPLPPESKIQALTISIFCGSTAGFVSDLHGNDENRFSPYAASLEGKRFLYNRRMLQCLFRQFWSFSSRSYMF